MVQIYMKEFAWLTIICALGLVVVFFANYPLKDWFPFATLIFPLLGEYSLVELLNRFAWAFVAGGGLAFVFIILWKVDW